MEIRNLFSAGGTEGSPSEGASQKEVCKGRTFLLSEYFGIRGMLKTQALKKIIRFFLSITCKTTKRSPCRQFEKN